MDEKDNKPELIESPKPEEKKRQEKEKDKEKGRSIASRLGDYKGEYKKIIWPTKQQLTKETLVVIVMCLIVGAVITVMDLAFSNGYNLLIRFLG